MPAMAHTTKPGHGLEHDTQRVRSRCAPRRTARGDEHPLRETLTQRRRPQLALQPPAGPPVAGHGRDEPVDAAPEQPARQQGHADDHRDRQRLGEEDVGQLGPAQRVGAVEDLAADERRIGSASVGDGVGIGLQEHDRSTLSAEPRRAGLARRAGLRHTIDSDVGSAAMTTEVDAPADQRPDPRAGRIVDPDAARLPRATASSTGSWARRSTATSSTTSASASPQRSPSSPQTTCPRAPTPPRRSSTSSCRSSG